MIDTRHILKKAHAIILNKFSNSLYKIHSIPPVEKLSINDDQQIEEEKVKTPDAIPTIKLDGKLIFFFYSRMILDFEMLVSSKEKHNVCKMNVK